MIIGYLLPADYMPPENTMTVLLMILILLVGIGLKGSGITLKEVLLNRRGVEMSIIFTLSVLVGGLIFALMFTDVSWTKGLALASGFGWYSLSAIVMTDAYGAVWGSVALFNDLVREFLRYSLFLFLCVNTRLLLLGLVARPAWILLCRLSSNQVVSKLCRWRSVLALLLTSSRQY